MKRYSFILPLIILLGIALRLFILSYRGSLWFDEAFSVHFASMDLGRMLSYLRFENNPPFYFILLHFWMKIFGNAELATRLLSMSFGLAAIPLTYLIGKRLHSSTAGLFASFLTAISSFQVFYSVETRMYSLYMFLALAAMLLYKLLEERRNNNIPCNGLRLLFFLTLSLLIWTHTTAWLIIAALALYVFWKSGWSPKNVLAHHKKFVLIICLLLLQFIPWGWHFFTTKIVAPVSQGWVFFLPPSKNFFLDILQSFLAFGEDSAFIVTLLSILIFGLLISALRKSTNPTGFLLFWLFTPLVVGFALNNGVLRYFIASSPALYLLLGIGFANLPKTKLPRWPIPFLFFFLIVPSYVWLTWYAHHQWNKLSEWIEQRETCNVKRVACNELVLVNPHSEILPLERYYNGTLPVKGFYPREDSDDPDTSPEIPGCFGATARHGNGSASTPLSLKECEGIHTGQVRDLRIVKTNWRAIVTKENIRTLADYTEGFNRVFLVSGEIDLTSRNVVPLWFWEQGWKRIESQEFGRIGVMLLERR